MIESPAAQAPETTDAVKRMAMELALARAAIQMLKLRLRVMSNCLEGIRDGMLSAEVHSVALDHPPTVRS